MKVTSKLTGILALLVVLVLAAETWVRARRELELYRAEAERAQLLLGRAITTAVIQIWQTTDREPALALLARVDAADERLQIRWIPEPERGGSGCVEGPRRTTLAQSGLFAPVTLTTTLPAAVGGDCLGRVVVSESLDLQHRYLMSVLTSAGTLGLATLLAWIAVTWAVGRVVVGDPASRLVAYARRIGDGHFTDPCPLAQRDELGQLGRELEQMARHLAAARADLEAEAAARLRTAEQLRHADRLTTVGRLASGVAHEVGTPLNVVQARAEMIERGETDDPRASARVIREQAERITRIVRQLLDFARKRPAERQPCDFSAAARAVAEMLGSLARKHGVELAVEAPEPGVVAPAVRGEVEQVMTNLVVNAIQASPAHGRVTLGVAPVVAALPRSADATPRPGVAVTVVDQGPGIPADVAPHVFDPFFTTKEVGTGTGLGLSVSYGIVEEHGGFIEQRTRPEGGAEFLAFFPGETAP